MNEAEVNSTSTLQCLETYLVATNPEIDNSIQQSLHVLFTGESQTKPVHKQGPKFYEFYILHIVISGFGYFQTDRGRYKLSAGDLFLIRPQDLITYESDSKQPWHYVWIAFTGDHVNTLLDHSDFSLQKDTIALSDIKEAVRYCRDIYVCFKERQLNATLRSNGYLLMLFALFNSNINSPSVTHPMTKSEHPVVKHIIHYLASQYSSPISFETMAETLGYNRAYLSRLFKTHIGMSPRSYLLHYRLDHARYLLRTRHDLTIEQIAASVGIQDALYFSKQFRLYTSYTPTAYRLKQQL